MMIRGMDLYYLFIISEECVVITLMLQLIKMELISVASYKAGELNVK